MSATTCPTIRELLPWFVGGDLEASQVDEVRAHLRDCLACRSEAAALQQGVARLQRAGASTATAVDDTFFASMHADIVERAMAAAPSYDAPMARASARPILRPWVPLAAAALVAFGFWLGHGGEPTVFDRPALRATPAAVQAPIVVPYSGPRVELVPLGTDGIQGGEPAGMMARSRLHDLVDEDIVLPRSSRPR